MPIHKKFYLPIKSKALLMIFMYVIATIGILRITVDNHADSILFHSIVFMIVLIINRLSNGFLMNHEKMKKYMYVSETCFVLYILFVFISGSENFLLYKLFIIPSILLSIYQSFRMKRIKSLEKI